MRSVTRITLSALAFCIHFSLAAQTTTNTFPPDGHVGIGTTNPENSEGWDRVLQVQGNSHSKLLVSETSGGVYSGLWSRSSGYYGNPAGGFTGTWSNHPFSIMTNRQNRMTITTDGHVGIGGMPGQIQPGYPDILRVAAPNHGALTMDAAGQGYVIVKSGGAESAMMLYTGANGIGQKWLRFINRDNAFRVESLSDDAKLINQHIVTFKSTGNVGFGTLDPISRLDLSMGNSGGISLGTWNQGGPGTMRFIGVTGLDGTINGNLLTPGSDNGAAGMAVINTTAGLGKSQDVAFYTHLSGVQSSQKMLITAEGKVKITDLAGNGIRMVVADANGQLSTQAIGSGGTTGGSNWTVVGGNIYRPSGFVSIGAQNTLAPLHVKTPPVTSNSPGAIGAYSALFSDEINTALAIRNLSQGSMQIATDQPNGKLTLGGGVFEKALTLFPGGKVGIGDITNYPADYKLAVAGNIIAEKLKVKLQVGGWPDYVFQTDYTLPSLASVEAYIKAHKHLPGIPSATEVEKEGLDVGAQQAALLKKVEELTLYIIEQNKQLIKLQEEVKGLKTVESKR